MLTKHVWDGESIPRHVVPRLPGIENRSSASQGKNEVLDWHPSFDSTFSVSRKAGSVQGGFP